MMKFPRSFRMSTRRSARRGVMLLIVTLVLAALTLSGAALLTLMKTEREATGTRGRTSIVKSVDRSAVTFLIAAVESTDDERAKFGGLYNNPNYFCAKPLLTLDEGGVDTSRFTVVSPKFEDTKIDGIRYGLVDESTRLNLEAVLAWENEKPGAGRDALMKLPGMTAIAADSILDWIDPDEKARSNGAEAKYYASKKLPYSPRNAVPVFLEELLLARGVTRSQLYGSDENFTYNADKIQTESESTLGGSLGGLGGLGATPKSAANESVPWKELITVFSAEKDVDPKGEARVDLNGTDLQFLYSELESRVGADLAKFVVLYRQYGPQQTTDEASGTQGQNAGQGGQNRRRSGYAQGTAGANGGQGGQNDRNGRRRSGYAFGSNAQGTAASGNVGADGQTLTPGTLASAKMDYSTQAKTQLTTPLDLVGARVVVGNVVYDSPIGANANKTNNDKLFQLLDYCSTSESTTIVGRVNVNAAPRAVLETIPGLSAADAQKIVDRRPDMSQTLPSDYRHAAWLYTKGLVDLATMRRLYTKVCAKGDVYRGQVIGFLDGSDDVARAEVVVDGTTIPPRQVFYKDLTTLGKGFTPAVLLGGSAVAQQAQVGGTDADWKAASTDILDIESERTSGYNSGANESSDPFAAVDAANGLGNIAAGGVPGAQSNAGAGGLGGTNANTGLGGGTDALSGGSLSPSSGADASSATSLEDAFPIPDPDAASAKPATRKEKLLDALRANREQRQARYDETSGTNKTDAAAQDAQAPQEAPAPDAAPNDAGSQGGGAGGNRRNGNGANGNGANGGGGGGNRGAGRRGGGN